MHPSGIIVWAGAFDEFVNHCRKPFVKCGGAAGHVFAEQTGLASNCTLEGLVFGRRIVNISNSRATKNAYIAICYRSLSKKEFDLNVANETKV